MLLLLVRMGTMKRYKIVHQHKPVLVCCHYQVATMSVHVRSLGVFESFLLVNQHAHHTTMFQARIYIAQTAQTIHPSDRIFYELCVVLPAYCGDTADVYA